MFGSGYRNDIRDVKFASGDKEYYFCFFTHTPMCVSTVYSVQRWIIWINSLNIPGSELTRIQVLWLTHFEVRVIRFVVVRNFFLALSLFKNSIYPSL